MPGHVTQPRAAVELVVAVAENDVIGRDNGLPWRLSADLRHFKATTIGHDILMGRKTFESIGKALPGRRNFVLTRSADFAAAECTSVRSLDEALAATGTGGPLMVIGGAQVYRLSISLARRIHLTIVHTRIVGGDAYFDGWRQPEWREVGRERHESDDRNNFAYSFVTLDRV
jgi:dihydrofolate reductase